ncbi:hypothetical protein LTR27_005740 [Elasticomyces elasticus]|nr:hypothetical protein LTR27_005740 [Elasticomyces elasticus]
MAVSLIPMAAASTLQLHRPPHSRHAYSMAPSDGKKKGRQPAPKPLTFGGTDLNATAPEFSFTSPISSASATAAQPALTATTSSSLLSPQTPRTPQSAANALWRNRDPSQHGTSGTPADAAAAREAENLARLNRKNTGLEEQADDFFTRWGDEQIKNTALTKALSDSETERKRLAKQIADQTKDATSSDETFKETEKELDQARKDKKEQEGKLVALQKRFDELDRQLQIAESTVDDTEKDLKKAEEQRIELEATNAGLQAAYDEQELEFAKKVKDLEQNGDAQQQLDKVIQTFQQEFRNLSEGVSIDDYLQQLRQTVQGSRNLRRDGSQASLAESSFGETHGGPSRARGNREVSGASIGDELNGHGMESDDEDDENHAAGDADDTIQNINTGHSTNNWLPGEATVEGVHGDTVEVSTQTPDRNDSLIPDPFPRTKQYADASTWTSNDKGVQTTVNVPTVAQDVHDRVARLHKTAQADIRKYDDKFKDQFEANKPLRDQIQKQKQEIATLKGKISEHETSYKALEKERNDNANSLNSAKTAQQKAEKHIAVIDAEWEEHLDQRLRTLSDEWRAHEAEVVAKWKKDCDELHAFYTREKKTVLDLNAKILDLDGEIDLLERVREEGKQTQEKLDNAKIRIDKLVGEVEKLQREGKDAKETHEKDVKTIIDDAKARIDELDADVKRLQRECADAKETHDKDVKTIDGAKFRIGMLEDEVKEFERVRDEAKKTHKETVTKLEAADTRVTELERDIKDLTRQRDEAQASAQGSSSADLTDARVVNLQTDLDEMKMVLDQEKKEHKKTIEELTRVELAAHNSRNKFLVADRLVIHNTEQHEKAVKELERKAKEAQDKADHDLREERRLHALTTAARDTAQYELSNARAAPPRDVDGPSNMLSDMPGWLRMLLGALLVLFVAFGVHGYRSRSWFTANDQMHQRVMHRGDLHYNQNSMMWAAIGQWLGADLSLES